MTRKKLIIGLVALLIVVAAITCTLILVLGGNDSNEPGPTDDANHPESGVYYFDAKYDEYTLTLTGGNKFNLIFKGEISFGSYTLENEVLTLDFDEESKANVQATLKSGVVTMTYSGSSMRLIKKINYTVSFETNGGSSISSATVVNGKTATKPADPTRDGYLFVGWYADEAFTQPFSFESKEITANTTLYARWSEKTDATTEYTVSFDLGYDGAEAIEPETTQGGKLFALPSPERVGFEFKGWWLSQLGDPSKLVCEYKEGMSLGSNTTLYALWVSTDAPAGKLPAPLVSVQSGSISWGAISSARSYSVKVTNAAGATVFETDTSATTLNVPFDTYAPGEYKITVTALASSGDANNSECVRYFVNKALDKVSVFNVVEPAVLNFNTVPGAEKYLITVVCGNPDHNHTSFDNGSSRSFSFANCEMTEGGIAFTVTAVADGYASSTSDVFVYKRELSAVEGLRVDASTETVLWNEVPGASHYMVSVNCGNAAHSHDFVNNGSSLSVSLKECSPASGGITVKVYPVSRGYISPAPTEISFAKTSLPTPSGVRVTGLTVSWNAVEGATEYEVSVDGKAHKATGTSIDLSNLINPVEGTVYKISVRAIGATESLPSDEVTAVYLEKPVQLGYSGGILFWSPVLGAESYEIQVNGGESVLVDGGKTSAEITLTKAGVNTVKVRFVDGYDHSDWATVEIFAHEVIFDTRGGNQIATQYKAVGDKINLPSATKSGYEFVAWYNVPGGPHSNGRLYNDETFSESGSIVLYAYYTAVEVNVTLNAGGADNLSDKITFEEYYSLTVPTPPSPTMAFGGWYSAPYGEGDAYTDAKGNSLSHWDSLESVELHAYWIDYALAFTQTKLNGKDVYMVSAGERIALLQEVTVPANFNGLPVAEVAGNAFKNCTTLKVINLPDTIESVSLVDPFTGCTALEAVNVYSTDRGTSRFWSDNGVLFDNGAGDIAQPKLLFMPLAKTGSYRIPAGIVEIPEGAFANSALSRITVPASVKKIGTEAFANCLNLTSVTFATATGEEELTIGARAFLGCARLEKITLPKRLSSIALTKYDLTDSVVSLDSASNAFLGCSSLESINVASGNATYKSQDGVLYSKDGKTLLYCPPTLLGSYTVSSGVQTIAPGAFIGCTGILEVTIPNTVTTIGEYAFYGLNSNLTGVTFSGNGFNNVSIGKYAFGGCSALSELNFESGSRVSAISEGAFYGCAITELEIPATVTDIGKYAFSNCGQLQNLSFAANGNSLTFAEGVFANCYSLSSVYIPANVTEISGIFSGCPSLMSVTIDENNPNFESEDGVVFNKGKTQNLYFPQGKLGEYTLPSTVTSIASGVFYGNAGITKLILPNTLSSIGNEAFKGSSITEIVFVGDEYADELHIGSSAFESTMSLKSLTLPKHTKSIGDYAFYGSAIRSLALNDGLEAIGSNVFKSTFNLFDISIPGSIKSIPESCFVGSSFMEITLNEGTETIGKSAFSGLNYLQSITIPKTVKRIDAYAFSGSKYLTEITFAEGSALEVIGARAFETTAIKSISLPKSLTSIGAYAFYYCTSLKTVTFENGGTDELVIGAPHSYTKEDDYTDNMITVVEVGHVFDNATALSTVLFPKNLVEIKEYSFYSAGTAASSLDVSFGEGSHLTTIGAYCFYDSALTSITVPASVRNLDPVVNGEFGLTYDRPGIGAYAFASSKPDKSKLASVTFELGSDEALTVGNGAFKNAASLVSVSLPKRLAPYTGADELTVSGLVGGADVFDGAVSLGGVTIEDGCKDYADLNGVVYTADLTELIFCPKGYVGEVTVPASVTKINDRAFYGCVGVTAISFVGGTSDMTIGNSAFEGCSSITEIILPSNAVSLGERAFAGCTSLESITLSKHIDKFESSMIENCPSLKEFIVEAGGTAFFYDNGALYTADKTTLVLFASSTETVFTALPSTVKIMANAFSGNTTLTSVILPDGLREIGVSAFEGCAALVSVNIPGTVELICESAFAGCRALKSVTFDGGDAELIIGDEAFARSGIEALELSARVKSLGNEVFASSSLSAITFKDGSRLEKMGDSVFVGTNIREITLPEGLTSIGSSTFERTDIQRVYLPASLKVMGKNTFNLCQSLTEVHFPTGSQLEIIPVGTFSGSSITEIRIPASVSVIQSKDSTNSSENGAFALCSSLTTVIFAEHGLLAEIGQNAFQECTALREIVIPSSVSKIGYLAFWKCTALESVTIPAATTVLGHSLFLGCTSLTNVKLDSKTTELPQKTFYGCSSLKTITIPSNVTAIGEDCFFGTALEEILVADGSTAFASRDGILYKADFSEIVMFPPMLKAESVTIPKQITTVSADVFTGSLTLKKVIFEEGGSAALTISPYAFQNCYGLHTVILPERLEIIGGSAFEGCVSLTSITLPSSLKEIGTDAFKGCYKLVEVRNESTLNVTKSEEFGFVGYYALNVYTPEAGKSIVSVDESGYVFAEYTANSSTVKYLVAYVGSEKNLALPSNFDSIYSYAFYRLDGLESVLIPKNAGAAGIGQNVFFECGQPLIIFEADATPASWGSLWNGDGCTVILGFDGREHTYVFNTEYGTAPESVTSNLIITLPTLESTDGKVFVGWCTTPDLSGTPIKGSYYSSSATELYAVWVDEGEDIPSSSDGSSIETAFDVKLDEKNTVLIDRAEKKVYFKFTPTVTGIYHAYVSGHAEAKLSVNDMPNALYAVGGVIDKDIPVFTAGNTYYIVISLTSSGTAELSFTLALKQAADDGGNEGDGGDSGNQGSSFDDAIELTLDKEITKSNTLASSAVYYSFVADKTAKYTVSIYGSGAILTVYASDRTTVIETLTIVSPDVSGSVDITLTEGEIYYFTFAVRQDGILTAIKVKEFTEGSGGSGSAPEADAGFDSATALTADTKLTLQMTQNQKAYFVYTAETAGEYGIKLLCSSSWDYATVKIYNSAKVTLKDTVWSENGSVDVTQTMTAGATYYIVVTMLYNDGTLDLTLTSPKAETPDEGGEGGTTVAGGASYDDATEITLGATYNVSCSKRGKKLYLKFTATEGGVYHLLVTGHKNAMVTVQNSNKESHGSLLQASWATESLDKDVTEFVAGETYYFIVQISGGTGELEFTLTEAQPAEEEA